MKQAIIITFLLLMALCSYAQVNGELILMGDHKVLHVWGNHYERGFAQGYILAEETWEIFYNYYYQWVVYSNPSVYNTLLAFMQARFETDARYISEATGILEGMEAAGINLYNPGLGRDITVDDVLLGNAIVDMRNVRNDLMGDELQLGCASLSSWGESTQADSTLNGNLVLTRLMDWDRNSYLLDNPILVVHHPSESNEQKWISFTYPGFIGALSGISESGSAAFLNVSNVNSYQYSTGLRHVLFSVRDGIEQIDYDGDGMHRGEDIYQSVFDHQHLSGTLVHAVWENDAERFAGIIENNWWGTELRTVEQNGSLPGMNLAVTNHFRLLNDPICCGRYEAIVDSLQVSSDVSAKRQRIILTGAAGWENNLMFIQYSPSLGTLQWSFANSTLPAYQNAGIGTNVSCLFDYLTNNSDPLTPTPTANISIYPNPYRAIGEITLKSDLAVSRLQVFNLRGQKIYSFSNPTKSKSWQFSSEMQDLPNGMYLLQMESVDGQRKSGKLLICR